MSDADITILDEKVWRVVAKSPGGKTFRSSDMTYIEANHVANFVISSGFWEGDPTGTCEGRVPDINEALKHKTVRHHTAEYVAIVHRQSDVETL